MSLRQILSKKISSNGSVKMMKIFQPLKHQEEEGHVFRNAGQDVLAYRCIIHKFRAHMR